MNICKKHSSFEQLSRFYVFFFIGIVLSFGANCAVPETEAAPTESEGPIATPVEVAVLETTPFEERSILVGETRPIRAAMVTPEAGGRLTMFSLEEGTIVEEEERVAEVDTSLTRSQRNQLQIELEQIESEIRRTRRLIDRNLATEPELERLETNHSLLEEQIRSVRIMQRQARVNAPLSGVVVSTFVEAGEVVGPGSPLARIIDMSTVVVRVGLAERDLSFVREGMEAVVTLEAINEEISAQVDWIGLEANPLNRTFPLEVHLDNSNGQYRSGMRASVRLVASRNENAVLAPRDAILQGVNGNEVIIVEDGKAAVRSVTVGAGNARYVVVEEGLQAGDQLIIRGQNSVVTGENVSIVATENCCNEQVTQ